MYGSFRLSPGSHGALIGVALLCALSAGAVPTSVTSQDSADCDVLSVPTLVEELGNPATPPFGPSGPFPADEAIASTIVTGGGEIGCSNSPGEVGISPLVRITNLTTTAFDNVWYVADTTTFFVNYDGLVNGSFAVKLDAVGFNQPLVAESIAADGIFAPGEAWDFLLGGFDDVCGRSVTYLGSIGVPSDGGVGGECSGSFPPPDGSTGSIIATPVPEPGTLGLVALGLIALVRRDRRR
jgi:hypothetical protein